MRNGSAPAAAGLNKAAAVADLLVMVEDLRILEAVLGERPEPEVDEDIKLIRDQLDQITCKNTPVQFDDKEVVQDLENAESLLRRIQDFGENQHADKQLIPLCSAVDETLFLSAQSSFIRRVLRTNTTQTTSISALAGGRFQISLVPTLTGLSASVLISDSTGSRAEIFFASDSREERIAHVEISPTTEATFTVVISPDLNLEISTCSSAERRADLLWVLEAENPKLLIRGSEDLVCSLIE